MEIQSNLKYKILSYKSIYIDKLSELVNKSNYGEDICCCSNNLFLVAKLINRLECYCFDSNPLGVTKVNATFGLKSSNTSYPSGTVGQVIVDGIQVGSIKATGSFSEIGGTSALLNLTGFTYTSVLVFISYAVKLTALPKTKTILIRYTTPANKITERNFTLVTPGVQSKSSCHNCIKDADLNKMYEVLDNLLK